MTFAQSKPWERKHLQPKDSRDFVNVPLNDEERKILRELQQVFHCDKEATVIKKCLQLVHGNVTQNPNLKAFFEWLSEARRVRSGPRQS